MEEPFYIQILFEISRIGVITASDLTALEELSDDFLEESVKNAPEAVLVT